MSKNSRNIDYSRYVEYDDGTGSIYDDDGYLEWAQAQFEKREREEEEEKEEMIAKMKYEELARCNEELSPVVDFYDAVAVVRAPYSVEELRKTYREISRKRKEILNLLSDFMHPKYRRYFLDGDEIYSAKEISKTAERVLNKMENWINDMDQ